MPLRQPISPRVAATSPRRRGPAPPRSPEAVLLRHVLEEAEHGILGEEHDSVNLGAEWVWVIDPIDGTKAFTCGKPQFGSLIALTHCGVPVVGVIDQPITGERWTGVKDAGSWFNGQPVRANAQVKPLAETIVLVTTPDPLSVREVRFFAERLKEQGMRRDALCM